MSPEELKLIKGNLYDLLIYSDNFLDHLSEILVLADLVSTKPYRLVKSEYSLKQKGVTIDFRFKDTITCKYINVEVYSIKLTQNVFEPGYKYGLSKFIQSKLENKLKEKDKSNLDYILFPVLWPINTNEKDYMPDLISHFREHTFVMEKVITPHTILMGQDAENRPITQFLSVSEFKDEKYKYF